MDVVLAKCKWCAARPIAHDSTVHINVPVQRHFRDIRRFSHGACLTVSCTCVTVSRPYNFRVLSSLDLTPDTTNGSAVSSILVGSVSANKTATNYGAEAFPVVLLISLTPVD